MNRVLFHLVAATTLMLALNAFAQGEAPDKSSIAPIRVQGRHLVDPKGNCVRLMGVMQSIRGRGGSLRNGTDRIISTVSQGSVPRGSRLMGVMQSIHPFFNCGYWGGGSDDAAAERAKKYYDTLFKGLTDRSQGAHGRARAPDGRTIRRWK